MDFNEGMMRMMIEEPSKKKKSRTRKPKKQEKRISEPETAGGRTQKWKLFQISSPFWTGSPKPQLLKKEPPREYVCPILGSIMVDPVIVTSGHSFERSSVEACRSLHFTPVMTDSSVADFSTVIPNLALKSAIDAWCKSNSGELPKLPDPAAVERFVREHFVSCSQSLSSGVSRAEEQSSSRETVTSIYLESEFRLRPAGYRSSFSSIDTNATPTVTHHSSVSSTDTNTTPTVTHHSSVSSIDTNATLTVTHHSTVSSTDTNATPTVTHPGADGCSSWSSPSSEIMTSDPRRIFEAEDIVAKMNSQHAFEVEEGLITLRETTRCNVESRTYLCTSRLLDTLKTLITESYTGVQVNALASLFNLSLEPSNKEKFVRRGMVIPLIEVLKSGSLKAQEHAVGAIFNLSLDNEVGTGIGVLGGLEPLMRLLRARSKQTRDVAVRALFYLTQPHNNQLKLVKSGAVPDLLDIARSGWMTRRILMVLVNLSKCPEGRTAMVNSGVLQCIEEILNDENEDEDRSKSKHDLCVMLLYELRRVGLRFRVVGMKTRVLQALRKVEPGLRDEIRLQARVVMEELTDLKSEEEYVNLEEVLDNAFGSENPSRFSSETVGS